MNEPIIAIATYGSQRVKHPRTGQTISAYKIGYPETLSEFQLLSWEPDDIAFAREIIQEADAIMQDVMAGLEWISQNPAALNVLQTNIRKVFSHHKKLRNRAGLRLIWTCATTQTEISNRRPVEDLAL